MGNSKIADSQIILCNNFMNHYKCHLCVGVKHTFILTGRILHLSMYGPCQEICRYNNHILLHSLLVRESSFYKRGAYDPNAWLQIILMIWARMWTCYLQVNLELQSHLTYWNVPVSCCIARATMPFSSGFPSASFTETRKQYSTHPSLS